MTTTPPTTIPPAFSSGSDTKSLTASLSALLRTTSTAGHWQLTPKGNGVERTFKFKTFKKTWEFMNAVAKECKAKKHHPEWSNVYNTTFIRWTTHSPPGLSVKDVEMARFCDEQAVLFGELVVDSDASQKGAKEAARDGGMGEGQGRDVGRELADRVAVEGGDCCVPQPKAKA